MTNVPEKGQNEAEGEMKTTAMSAAFDRAGWSAAANDLWLAIAKFMNSGGTIAELRQLVERAEKLAGGAMDQMPQGRGAPAPSSQPQGDVRGRQPFADNGPEASAPPSPPKGDAGGHSRFASDGQSRGASPSPPKPSEGRGANVSDGQQRDADAGSPNRERAGQTPIAPRATRVLPSPAREPVLPPKRTAAQKEAAKFAARFEVSIFNNYKINPNMKWRELMVIARERGDKAAAGFMTSMVDTAAALFLLKMARYNATVSDDSMKVIDLVPASMQRRFDTEARREAPLLLKEASSRFRVRLIEDSTQGSVQ